MPDRWIAEQVLALAPDAPSANAGRKLSSPGPWTQTGATATPWCVWGLCAGSGSKPYQTVVDLSEPAFACSCPSRKFPCKHALGLLLLWSAGHVPDREAPSEFASTWLSAREVRAAKAAATRTAESPPVSPRAATQRTEQRDARVSDGVADLDTWLRDQARTGLAGSDRAGYGDLDPVAARLIDAQAPGLAAAVRRLAAVAASGDGWPGRLLEEYALLRLIVSAHQRLGLLGPELATTVRSRIGYPTRQDAVLTTPAIRDRWDVLSLRDTADDRLLARRVHLHGSRTGRDAVLLSFAPPGQPLDTSLVPGTSVELDLHFYPGALAVRAVVGVRHGEPGPLSEAAGCSVRDAINGWAAAVAADPWVTDLPVLLADVTLVSSTDGSTTGWFVVDRDDDVLPVVADDGLWTLLAVGGGHPVTLAAERTPNGLHARAARSADGFVTW